MRLPNSSRLTAALAGLVIAFALAGCVSTADEKASGAAGSGCSNLAVGSNRLDCAPLTRTREPEHSA